MESSAERRTNFRNLHVRDLLGNSFKRNSSKSHNKVKGRSKSLELDCGSSSSSTTYSSSLHLRKSLVWELDNHPEIFDIMTAKPLTPNNNDDCLDAVKNNADHHHHEKPTKVDQRRRVLLGGLPQKKQVEDNVVVASTVGQPSKANSIISPEVDKFYNYDLMDGTASTACESEVSLAEGGGGAESTVKTKTTMTNVQMNKRQHIKQKRQGHDATKKLTTMNRAKSLPLIVNNHNNEEQNKERHPHVMKKNVSFSTLNVESDTQTRTGIKKVSFSTVEVRKYPMILGDHPDCQQGAPITIDWECIKKTKIVLDRFEIQRSMNRRPQHMWWVGPHTRMEYLKECTETTNEEIQRSIIDVQKIRDSRLQSMNCPELIQELKRDQDRQGEGFGRGERPTLQRESSFVHRTMAGRRRESSINSSSIKEKKSIWRKKVFRRSSTI